MGRRIREARPDDAAAVLDIYGPFVEGTSVSFETEVPCAAEMGRRIEEATRSLAWLVFEDDAEVAGFAYAIGHHPRAAYRWSADVALYVGEGTRRQGVGTALYRSLFSLLRLLGVRSAVARIALPNPASVGLHESLGFRRVALYPSIGYKLGAWRDVGHWLLPLRPTDGAPLPLARPEELRGTPAWEAALSCGIARYSGITEARSRD